jgi:hypothetical protein
MARPQAKQLVVCVDNAGYSASLEKRKIYVALRDADAEKHACFASSMNPETIISIRKRSSARSPCRSPSGRRYWPLPNSSRLRHKRP